VSLHEPAHCADILMCFPTKAYGSHFPRPRIASLGKSCLSARSRGYRAIMCCQPRPASLTSQRRQAAPPALVFEP
jgi:hypothetical protein